MRIAQLHPGLLPIPPLKWGAIEEIIWQYKLNFERLGHKVDITGVSNVISDNYDLVHCHVGRFVTAPDICNGGLHANKVPYVFTMHDVSPYYFDRDSNIYLENEDAIKYSLFSTVGCRKFRNLFSKRYLNKIEWLLHGTDTDFFTPAPFNGEHKLLCVGAKDIRKQFHLAVEAAKILDLPITIAGPERCPIYTEKYLKTIKYDKLNLISNCDKQQLKDLYQSHSIIVHPATLETGNPCLAVMDAMACGLPAIFSNMDYGMTDHDDRFPDMNTIHGSINCFPDPHDIVNKIKIIIEFYNDYSSDARKFALKHSWPEVCQRILDLHQYHTLKNKLFKYVK